MYFKKIKFEIFFLLILIDIIKGKEDNEKLETCDESNEHDNIDKYKILYDNYFLEQEKSSSNDFNFELNEKVINFLKNNSIISYPRSSFRGSLQGNFLHFMHLVYEKKLPLYFTVDQIIYPYIELTNDIIQKIIENGLYNLFYNFLSNVIEYGEKNNFDKNIINYFLIGFKFLVKEKKFEEDKIISEIVNNILDDKNIDDNNYYYNFTFLENERSINKINFIQINPLFNANSKTKNLFYCITYFQNFIFNIRNELFTVYSIGDIINKSGQSQIYKEIKKYFKYIFNEEENIMNPLEIYEYINNNYKNRSKTKDMINFNLYYKMKDIIIKNRTLPFMSNYHFYNEKEEVEFNNQKNSKLSLFSYSYEIEEWINYKLINIEKKRLFPSFYEYITVVHNGNKMNDLIKNRYNFGKNNTKKNKNKMIKFRDGVNMENEFNEIKGIIDKSLKEDKNIWINSYKNSFNYLLNFIGHSKDDIKMNKMDKFGFESKIFNTLIGSYIHFKKDILLFEQLTEFEFSENGTFIDIYFEDNMQFYEELNEITTIFKNYSMNLIKNIEDLQIRKNLTTFIDTKLNRLFTAYNNIIKMIKFQKGNNYNEERRTIIKNIFYYNNKNKNYEGWYVDLYKMGYEDKINYNLNIYAYNYYISKPIKELDFKGAIIFGAMNYPEFGLISIKDKYNKENKLFILSFYSGNEYPHGWSDKIDYDSLKRIIIKR